MEGGGDHRPGRPPPGHPGPRSRRGGRPHGLQRGLRQHLGLRHRRGPAPGRHRQPGLRQRPTTSASGAGTPERLGTRRSSPTATSTTSSAWRRFEAEAVANGWAPPHVVAHELLPARFDRYVLTAGYNGVINQRQFQFPQPYWPTEYRYPDEVYRDHHTLTVGGETWELHHDKGETDDATWVWNPGRKVLCTGDLFIWASPNCGNPQKVQRYPREWAIGLRKMAGARRRGAAARPRLPDHRRATASRQALRRHRRAARVARRADPRADERRRPPRRDRAHRAGPAAPARHARTCSPSTTSPSSSCATCGASTAAGTTATPPTSSRRPTRPSPPRWRRSPAAPAGWPHGPRSSPPQGDLRLAGHLAELAA